jgi:uncharacterized damage-inducible protein DinB
MTYIEVFTEQYHDVYHDLREVLNDLPDEALNWSPYAGANSIAVLTTHILGNQLETLRTVAGAPTTRDRPSEFRTRDATAAGLLELVANADSVMHELAGGITAEQLDAETTRPSSASGKARAGLYHLGHSIAHAREHIGQAWMTRDLWKAQSGPGIHASEA